MNQKAKIERLEDVNEKFIKENSEILGVSFHTIKSDSYVSHMLKEVEALKDSEIKAIYPKDKTPKIYIINKDFIVSHLFSSGGFQETVLSSVFDNQHKFKFSYQTEPTCIDEIKKIESNNILYEKENYLKKKILLLFFPSLNMEIDALKTEEKVISFKKKKGIVKIELEDNYFTAHFNGNLYNEISFDYDFNIKYIDFNSLIKNKLQLQKMTQVNDYSTLLNRIESNIEIYNLTTDTKYQIKSTKKDFETQIELLKKIINNKVELIKTTKKVRKGILDLKTDITLFSLGKVNKLFEIQELNEHMKNYSERQYYNLIKFLANTKGNEKGLGLDNINKILDLNEKMNVTLKKEKILKKRVSINEKN